MSIDSRFTDTITIQNASVGFGGDMTYTTVGTNLGYRRKLSARQMVSIDKENLFSTHRFVMTTTTAVSAGQFILHNSLRYKVKVVDDHGLSGGDFQTADAEIMT